ncbi:MAG: GNAT family N-acetyltransferase [bacterium]
MISKKVIKFDIETKKILNEFNSLADAGRYNQDGLSYEQINRICLGYVKNNKDYRYCYKDDYLNNSIPQYIFKKSTRKLEDVSKEELIEIEKKYKENDISINNLAKEYNLTLSTLNKYLSRNDTQESVYDNINYVICKKTGKEFYDWKNTSGCLTNHLKKTYLDIEVPNNYFRKKLEKETGKFWYHDYFNFIYKENEEKETKKCKYCDWETNDINNLSGAYEKHLKNIHNVNLHQYIESFPEETDYFNKEIINPDTLIECKICGEKLKILNDKHLQKHGITVGEYKLKYGINIVSNASHLKLSKSARKTNKSIIIHKTSAPENELKEFLSKYLKNIEQSKRKILLGQEIDLYFSDLNIGIEFNGCKYHSEIYGKKDKNYHLNKTILANKNNINLIHIFEDEWEYKKEIVKKKLKHILNLSNDLEKIYARKCEIKFNVNVQEKIKFLENNHIQGNDKSLINVGAYYNNRLVALMTFDNKRELNKEKEHDENIYELTRFATDNNYRVIGIGSRLLKNFIREYNPLKIISFADRRWTLNPENNLYTKLGFKLIKILKPDYTYFNSKYDRYKRFHKFGFGKSSIKRKFPEIYDENKTEWMMMQESGFDRIWDCGKFKYELFI